MHYNMRSNCRLRLPAPSHMPLSPRHSDTPYLRLEVFERRHLEATREARGTLARPCRTRPEGITTVCPAQKGRGRRCRSEQHPACCLAPTLSHYISLFFQMKKIQKFSDSPRTQRFSSPFFRTNSGDPSEFPKERTYVRRERGNLRDARGGGGFHGWTQGRRSEGCVWKARAWWRLRCTVRRTACNTQEWCLWGAARTKRKGGAWGLR
jgi:hypothetical protein